MMAYTFLGVSILADIFVGSIDVITRRWKKVKLKNGNIVTVKAWNDTVANLSLMALGSSAPEICLSVIEAFKGRFFMGRLGVATILGSGAFNLLVIVAVCVVAIPSSEERKIMNLPAFYITAAFSVMAYMWLGFILVNHTQDVVDVWEALTTFAFLPLLVYISYKVDIGSCDRFMPHSLLRFLAPDAHTSLSDAQECAASAQAPLLGFASETINAQGTSEKQTLEVNVALTRAERCGAVSCNYRTEQLNAGSAVPSYDYEEAEGRLEFSDGVDQQCIQLEILPKEKHKIAREFLVILDEPDGCVKFDPDADGGESSAILTVKVDAVSTNLDTSGKLLKLIDAAINIHHLRSGTAEWIEQFPSAIYCNGSAEEQKNATMLDWLWHVLCMPWKICFTLVPPPSCCGGWLCFCASLMYMLFMAAILTDMSELFGCVVGVEDLLTAVTFVSLGTSVPDLFASLSAAKMEPTADAAIINVTGSNSVNVFLGLGLPWSIGSIYWAIVGPTSEWKERYPDIAASVKGAVLVVDSNHLGWGILVFLSSTVACLSILLLRRLFLGAELGGVYPAKIATGVSFFCFWFGFITVIGYRSLRMRFSTPTEYWLVMSCLATLMTCILVLCVMTIFKYRRRTPEGTSDLIPSAPQSLSPEVTTCDDSEIEMLTTIVPSHSPLPGELQLLE
jgi:Ca2+/Na+ antiporter